MAGVGVRDKRQSGQGAADDDGRTPDRANGRWFEVKDKAVEWTPDSWAVSGPGGRFYRQGKA